MKVHVANHHWQQEQQHSHDQKVWAEAPPDGLEPYRPAVRLDVRDEEGQYYDCQPKAVAKVLRHLLVFKLELLVERVNVSLNVVLVFVVRNSHPHAEQVNRGPRPGLDVLVEL